MWNTIHGNGVSCRNSVNNRSFFVQSIVFWFILSTYNAANGDELHIGGIFPINGKGGWQGGQACEPAAKLALDDVNRKADLLPGFKLTLHSNDSEVSTNLLNIFPHIFVSSLYYSMFLSTIR